MLAAIVNNVRATHKVDDLRIYTAGVSAGGAMAVTMTVAYPELFSAIAVCAGLEYKAATNIAGALAAQKNGGPDPNNQGRQAYQAMLAAQAGENRPTSISSSRRRSVRVIVFHGALDTVVVPINANQTIAQWAQTNDLLDDASDNNTVTDAPASSTIDIVPNGYKFTRTIYNDAAGQPLLEKLIVQDMRHAWSGGSTAGTYTDPKGPDASRETWRFFQQTPRARSVRTSGRKR